MRNTCLQLTNTLAFAERPSVRSLLSQGNVHMLMVLSQGAKPSFALLEFGLHLPDYVMEHPQMKNLTVVVIDMICLGNVSLPHERSPSNRRTHSFCVRISSLTTWNSHEATMTIILFLSSSTTSSLIWKVPWNGSRTVMSISRGSFSEPQPLCHLGDQKSMTRSQNTKMVWGIGSVPMTNGVSRARGTLGRWG